MTKQNLRLAVHCYCQTATTATCVWTEQLHGHRLLSGSTQMVHQSPSMNQVRVTIAVVLL